MRSVFWALRLIFLARVIEDPDSVIVSSRPYSNTNSSGKGSLANIRNISLSDVHWGNSPPDNAAAPAYTHYSRVFLQKVGQNRLTHHPAFQISLKNHLTTSRSRWRISSNAERTKLQRHAGICRTREPQGLIFWLEDPGSQENEMAFGGVSVSDSFISQLGQDVVRGHFLLSPRSQGTQILKRILPWSGSSITTTVRSTLKCSTNLLLPHYVWGQQPGQ